MGDDEIGHGGDDNDNDIGEITDDNNGDDFGEIGCYDGFGDDGLTIIII